MGCGWIGCDKSALAASVSSKPVLLGANLDRSAEVSVSHLSWQHNC